jgi:tetratricopeptide (TPR) repeat protein
MSVKDPTVRDEGPGPDAEKERLQKEFEECCNSYGKAIEEGRHKDAEGLVMQMMQLAMLRSMNEEPSQEMVWTNMAAECEGQGNWAGAEEARRNALARALEDPKPEIAMKAHLDLAGLYEILNRRDEALAEVNAAVELGRKSEITTIRTMAFDAKARILLWRGENAAAREIILEALNLIPDEKIQHLSKAKILLLLARCELLGGETERAQQTLNEAMGLVRPYGESQFLGGVQAFYVQAGQVGAAICSARGERERAIEVSLESVTRARGLTGQSPSQCPRSTYRLSQALKRHAEYLEAGQRPADAAKARAESMELRRQVHLEGADEGATAPAGSGTR